MINQFYSDPAALRRLCFGPLGPHLDGFASFLSKRGYSRVAAKQKIRLVAALSHWLHRQGDGVHDLDERKVERFLRHRGKRYRVHRGDPPTLRDLLRYLRELGIVALAVAKIDNSPLDHLQRGFKQYLIQERGLAQPTIVNYLSEVRHFLAGQFDSGTISLERLGPQDIS